MSMRGHQRWGYTHFWCAAAWATKFSSVASIEIILWLSMLTHHPKCAASVLWHWRAHWLCGDQPTQELTRCPEIRVCNCVIEVIRWNGIHLYILRSFLTKYHWLHGFCLHTTMPTTVKLEASTMMMNSSQSKTSFLHRIGYSLGSCRSVQMLHSGLWRPLLWWT